MQMPTAPLSRSTSRRAAVETSMPQRVDQVNCFFAIADMRYSAAHGGCDSELPEASHDPCRKRSSRHAGRGLPTSDSSCSSAPAALGMNAPSWISPAARAAAPRCFVASGRRPAGARASA